MSAGIAFAGLLQLLRDSSKAVGGYRSDLQSGSTTLSRQFHPDRFAAARAADQQYALDATALLNDGYRVLT